MAYERLITRVLFGVAVLAFGGALMRFGIGPVATETRSRPNIVLVSIDTLRADHLGVYGYGRDTSPNIDALAEEAVVFENAYSQSSWTLPSHVSMLTGLDPIAHGVSAQRDRMTSEHLTLAEMLQAGGYWTGAWVGRQYYSFIGASRGFAQGFDHYAHAPHGSRARTGSSTPLHGRRADQTIGKGRTQISALLRWLAGPMPEPFFLFVHLDDVHSQPTGAPYDAPPAFRDRFCPGGLAGYTGCEASGPCGTRRLQAMRERTVPLPSAEELAKITCLYDGAVAFTDEQVGRLVRGLRERDVLDRTLFILTSDHGESLMEHDELSHFTVYEEVARVPLLIRFPGGRSVGREIAVVELVDLVPTILEGAGFATTTPLQGESLLGLVRSGTPVQHETALTMGWKPNAMFSWRRGGAKYLVDLQQPDASSGRLAAGELFDLHVDPAESRNQAERDPALANGLRQELDARRREGRRLRAELFGAGPSPVVDLPPEEQERLTALGYAE